MENPSRADLLIQTLTSEARTVIRSPHSTVAPPRQDARSGAQVLERLHALGRPSPLVEEEGPLGQGGMGVVRLATQLTLGRKVAVKRLRPGLTTREDVESLLAESWLSGSLEHPNIVPVHELGLDAEGLPVLVMKRIEGQSWATLLRDPDALAAHAPGRAPLEANLRIMMQVCNALHYAHARGVVHRDVKPDNVMVGAFAEVYLVDWGIAAPPGPAHQLAGTPVYMAPEMLGGAQAMLSARTDVYLLGAVLCELLTGRPPHDASSPEALAASILASSPSFPADVPEELASLASLCMSSDPAQRPESALAVRVVLEDFLAHLGSLELAAQAERSLGALQSLLGSPAPDSRSVFDLFSECRFGFQQALRGWAQNARARRGLEGAVRAMVRFELSAGSARTAQALLSELTSPDPALVAEVDAGLAAEGTRREDLVRLEALEKSLDPRTGSGLRMLMVLVAGLGWIIAPLLGKSVVARWPEYEMLWSAPVSGVSALALLFVGWKTKVGRTPLNAQLIRLIIFGMSVQTVALVAGHFVLGDLGPKMVPIVECHWFVLAGLIATLFIREAWLAAGGYLAAGLLAAYFPDWRYEAIALSNGVLCVNAALLWRKQLRA